jgi:hypothetical protein
MRQAHLVEAAFEVKLPELRPRPTDISPPACA